MDDGVSAAEAEQQRQRQAERAWNRHAHAYQRRSTPAAPTAARSSSAAAAVLLDNNAALFASLLVELAHMGVRRVARAASLGAPEQAAVQR